MNRPFLAELAKRAGYSVHERSSHGIGKAYDWGPKNPMASRHFSSVKEAQSDLEETLYIRLQDAETLIKISQEIIKEG